MLKIPTDSLPDEARLEISTKNIFGTYHRNDGLVNHDIGAEASVEIPIKNAEPEGDFDKVDIEDAEVIEESDGDYVLEPEITLYDDFLQGNPANCEEAVYDIKIEYEEEDDYWREITTLETNIEFDGYEVYYNDDNRVEIPADGGQGDVNVRVTLTAHDEYGGWEESVEESFEWEYKPELTIDIEGEGSTEPEEGTHTYDYNDEVTVTAIPDDGWYFEKWAGDVPDGQEDPEITIVMDENKEVTAHFEEYVVLSTTVKGEGIIQIYPDQDEYHQGEKVTIVATPDEGWYFNHWEGDVPDGQEKDSVINIEMDDDKSITAVFKEAFISTWNTEKPGESDEDQIELPLLSDGNYDFTVYWGDGNDDYITEWDKEEVTHTYTEPGTYTVEIGGMIEGWRFNNNGDAEKIVEISQWGALQLDHPNISPGGYYFYGCSNLELTATDAPDLTGTNSLVNAFRGCENLGSTGNMNGWDVSNVEDMSFMFYGASSFDQNIGGWDVSNVEDMSFMFYEVSAFNHDIGDWDVSNVRNMSGMFYDVMIFNRDIGDWDVSNVEDMSYMFHDANWFDQDIGGWDVSSVTNMSGMFSDMWMFNQDIGDWDVSNVEDMSYMFYDMLMFDQDIGDWDVSNVEDMSGMFRNNHLSVENYNSLLNGWSELDLQNYVEFHAGSSQYTITGADAREYIIDEYGWTIIYGGPLKNDITIDIEGEGSTDPPEGTHSYIRGKEVTIEAIEDVDGWRFLEWIGDVPESEEEEKEITITVDEDKSITAVFEENVQGWDDLNNIREDLDGYYLLGNDFDKDSPGYVENWEPIGDSNYPFTGILDGQGHTISGLHIDRPGEDAVGLFGYVGENASIKNVNFDGTEVTGDEKVGSLAGYNRGQVTNVSVNGEIAGDERVGGLIGNNRGNVSRSNTSATVEGEREVGGLVGRNRGDITDTHSTGEVTGGRRVGGLVGWNRGIVRLSHSTGEVTGERRVGGFVGWNHDHGELEYSYSSGEATGERRVGGFVGWNKGEITYSYSLGDVIGDRRVGGFAGWNHGTISTSYSTGFVTGDRRVGGFIGWNLGYVVSSFWDVETSGQDESDGGIGRPTEEMQSLATFEDAGWNITEVSSEDEKDTAYVWNIVDGETYPFLSGGVEEGSASSEVEIEQIKIELIQKAGESKQRVVVTVEYSIYNTKGRTVTENIDFSILDHETGVELDLHSEEVTLEDGDIHEDEIVWETTTDEHSGLYLLKGGNQVNTAGEEIQIPSVDDITISDLRTDEDEIEVGDEIELEIDVGYTGPAEMVYTVEFELDDQIVGTDTISLESGETKTASVTHTIEEKGDQVFEVGDENLSFTVEGEREDSDAASGEKERTLLSPVAAIIVILAITSAIGVAALLKRERLRSEKNIERKKD